MNRAFSLLLLALFLIISPDELYSLESAATVHPGLKSLRMVTDQSAIVPGETFTVGFYVEPLPEHHTYWRGPGIVGVATRLDWSLSEGFKVGPTIWPPPQKVLMAGILANGFKDSTLLLVDLTAPAQLSDDEVTLSVRCSWMSCSVSCNPGIADLSLTLPIAKPGVAPTIDTAIRAEFEQLRESAPKLPPSTWTFGARLLSPEQIELELIVPGLDPTAASEIHFYADDMQIDSDEPQPVNLVDPERGLVRLTLSRPEFAPKSPAALSGVLQCPGGWPELQTEYIEYRVPWPDGTFSR